MTTRSSIAVVVLGLLGSTAYAEVSPNDISIQSFNPEDAVAPTSTVEGPGIKVGEGTVLHPVVGLETGVVSNVFYEETDTRASGLLRFFAGISSASLSQARLNPAAAPNSDESDGGSAEASRGNFIYRTSLRASYDVFLTNNDTVQETGGLGLGFSLHGLANAQGRLSFGFDEDFERLIRAANFETDANTNRDLNNLRLLALYHPADRAVSGYLSYENHLDVFEKSEQSFADRMSHRVALHPMWRIYPQTQVYSDVSIGYASALDSKSTKSSSYPLVARVGIATLLSLKTTVNVDAGYTNGFYSNGPSYSAPVVGAALGYRYSPLGRVTLNYVLQFEDSINANYYRDHVLRASMQQLFNPFVFMIQPEVHFREYQGVNVAVPTVMGPDTRNDFIAAVVAGLHYVFRDRLAATLNYRFSTVQTDYRDATDDPSYVRHELLFGVRAAL